jgi:hypothetical protein
MNQLTQKVLKIITLILAMTTITAAQAEQKEVMGDWNVHYIAFGSGFLTPEIAKNYGITRSKYNGVVNISVLKNNDADAAQKVYIEGRATNLIGQSKKLKFKEIIEGKAIYYIAQISYSSEETFRFDIDISQGGRQENLKFKQQFFAE